MFVWIYYGIYCFLKVIYMFVYFFFCLFRRDLLLKFAKIRLRKNKLYANKWLKISDFTLLLYLHIFTKILSIISKIRF